jgi:NhaA family Na+:H+ antiporter
MTTHAITRQHVTVRRPARAVTPLVQFVIEHHLLLPLGAAIALVWANAWPAGYFGLTRVLAFPVNEIGMVLFFAVITQELVEETMPGGALDGWRRWLLPVIAAAGGVLGAAFTYLVYVGLKWELVLRDGWPVAAAVDVAFAYFVVKSIFRRHAAISFLLLLAIATTAIGIGMAAVRDSTVGFRPGGTVLMAAAIGSAALFRQRRTRSLWPFVAVCGSLSWLALYIDGIHPALALVPIVPFLAHSPRGLDLFDEGRRERRHSAHHLEHLWQRPVHAVLFLFGLVNAGVVLNGYGTATWATLTASLGGRTAGVLAALAVAGAAGLRLPRHLHWRDVTVIALAASCGLTFALFMATAIFPAGPILTELKLGALLSGVGIPVTFAAAWLLRVGRFAGRCQRPQAQSPEA